VIERRNNIPDWTVTLDGKDLTGKMRPRLVSLSISERRDEDADQLDITLDDSDGLLDLPSPGAVLAVAIGWKQGIDVEPGLVSKGTFKVDEIEHSGPPDQVTLKARSADFAAALRDRREQHWADTSLGTVLREIAMRNGLTARVAADLAGVSITSLTQSRESDIAFLRRLGADYDAVATIKAGCLIFARKGAGTTASGADLPKLAITRKNGDRHRWARQTRTDYKGVTASWHDKGAAKRKTVTSGEKNGSKHLRKVYANEAEAKRAAEAERARLKRMPATLDLTLAFGRASASPEQRATVTGFKAAIDAQEWLVSEVDHRIDQKGFITTIKLETAP
jgi:phage protein D